MKLRTSGLYLCLFLSGASALVYQVVWERMLTLVLGLSTLSVAAVLSAFLGGMAVGARVCGPLADRSRHPLRLYSAVELGIALTGLVTLVVIPQLMRAFSVVYGALEPGWFGSGLIRFGLALPAVGVPCLLIGATAPLMARLLAPRAGATAVGFGRGYAVNTAGAVLGTLAAGFFLVRLVGVQNTLLCAAGGNLVAAGLALALGRRSDPDTEALERLRAAPVPQVCGSVAAGLHPRLALIVAALTGGLALAYEVAWVRLLAVFTLNSVYVFTMVVGIYLAALAAGAALVTRLLRRGSADALGLLAVAQLLQALLVPVLLALAPLASRLDLRSGVRSETAIFWTEYALVAAVVLLPALLIGVGLPLLVHLASRSVADAGRTVGRIYAWNAAGTVAGAALTGVALIPGLGLRGTLLLLAAANLTVAAAAEVARPATSARWRALAPAGAAAFALLLALTPATTRFYVPADRPGENLLYYAEGPTAIVHVAEYAAGERAYRTLYVDSKSVAGTYDEIVTDQKMLAHLPLLLHPRPERALTVGFGTGGTSYSMLLHGVQVDCVEIEPRVPDAAALFASENHGLVGPAHDRADFRLILDDARAWLHVAPVRYDVIVTDLTSIQYRGNGNLYTAECFELLRARLGPGGIGAAWAPLTGITPEALRVLIRSFRAAFPHTSVWYMLNVPTDFVILVGTPGPLALRLDDVVRRCAAPRVRRDLAAIGMDDPHKLAACLLLAEPEVARYVGAGPVHRDDRPVLDYLTHATPYHNTLPANLVELAALRSDVAAYVTAWPDGAREPGERWAAWAGARGHLIAGHIALHATETDRRAEARAAYAAALALVPDDARTQALVRALEPQR